MYFTLLKYQRLLEAIGKSEDVGKSCRGRNQYSAVTERKKQGNSSHFVIHSHCALK
jgi:hypothetical protein